MLATVFDALSRDHIASLLANLWEDRRGPPGVFVRRYLKEDSIWRFLGWPESLLPGPRSFQGPDEITHAGRIIDACVEVSDMEIIDTIVEGNEAALLRRIHMRHRATGCAGALTVHDLVRFKEDRIDTYLQFLDTDAFAAILRGEGQSTLSRAANSMGPAPKPAKFERSLTEDAGPGLREARRLMLREFLAARVREGGRAFERYCTEDIVMHLVGDVSRVPFARRHSGLEAVKELVGMVDREFAFLGIEIGSVLIDGDRAAMHYVSDLRHRGTSSVGRNESLVHFTFEGDLLKTMAVYFDTARTAKLIEGS